MIIQSAALLLAAAAGAAEPPPGLRETAMRHLDSLIDERGRVVPLKGKSTAAMTAQSFYLMYEIAGVQRYRAAAVELADRILKDMRSMRHGVLYIKQKEKESGEEIEGGGPPALGWYASAAAYVCRKEGGRERDLLYLAQVLDRFPWNDEGWWAATIDVETGVPKLPLSKPSPINKNASMAVAAAMVSAYVRPIDAALADRLKRKADAAIYKQILPAQQPDGYWHYGLTGRDPNNKDVLGYFMLTTSLLAQLQRFDERYREPALDAALNKAYALAASCIAPMMPPNTGPPCRWTTRGTPARYDLEENTKRAFELAVSLFAGRHDAEGRKILGAALPHFPVGDRGESGAHAVRPSAFILWMLSRR